MLLNDAVETGRLGAPASVGLGLGAGWSPMARDVERNGALRLDVKEG